MIAIASKLDSRVMSNHRSLQRRGLIAVALLAAFALPQMARAADPSERYPLDPDFPVRMEDAYPSKEGSLYFKFASRYTENANGTGTTNLQPEIAWGFAKDLDLHVLVPNYIGDGDLTGSGDANANVQWMFHEQHQGDWCPSLAVEGDLILPTGGRNNDGLDTAVQFIATDTLSWAPSFDALHLNLTWTRNAADGIGERDDRYNVIFGYSRRIADNAIFTTDVFWEQQLAVHSAGQMAEAGLIQQLNDHVQLAAGVGVSLGDDAPDYTATLGIIISR